MEKLHNFMDKMRGKPIDERRRLLFSSTLLLGGAIAVFGLWDASERLFSLNLNLNNENLAVVDVAADGTGGSDIMDAWDDIRGGLEKLNDKLGAEEVGQNQNAEQ